jgi:tRNA A37 threonylcarbamoyladenosine dehydratase
MHLIATCLRERIRLVSSMGAAGRLDPTRVRVADLSETRVDPFARELRRLLRLKHGIDCTRPTNVRAVFTEEPPTVPQPLAYDTEGFLCVCPGGENGVHDCDHRNRVEGSTPFVPAAFGLSAAATAVGLLLGAQMRAAP